MEFEVMSRKIYYNAQRNLNDKNFLMDDKNTEELIDESFVFT